MRYFIVERVILSKAPKSASEAKFSSNDGTYHPCRKMVSRKKINGNFEEKGLVKKIKRG